MAISPINSINTAQSMLEKIQAQKDSESFVPFEDLLKNAVDQVSQTENAVRQDEIRVASGDMDALHTVTIDMAKADLALQTLVQVRSKAVDAYNEIMRISL